MKRLLFLALSVASVSSSMALAQEAVNGWMPPDYPATIEVANVPMGSGLPSMGQTSGYSEATPVSDGLYHVPGYLPYESTAGNVWPRVVNVRCHIQAGVWYCTGYHIDGVLERGEDIYVRPVLDQVAAVQVPIQVPTQHLIQVQPQPVTPVPHAHRPLLIKHKKPICN